jgi:protein-S-isoprenylcysteine O-methyltransferase Ste14
MTSIRDPGDTAPPATLPWPPILLVSVVVAALVADYAMPLPWPGANDLIGHIAGLSLGVAGFLLIAWAAWTLRRHGTTILPDKPADALVTDGPFRFRRNPIYIGHVLMLLGIAEITQNIWFAILAIPYVPLVTWLAVLPEERHLEARFGNAYRAYKARTRRWI